MTLTSPLTNQLLAWPWTPIPRCLVILPHRICDLYAIRDMDSFVEHKHLAPIWADSILNYFLYLSILPTPAFLLASGHRKVDSRKNIGVLVTIKLSYIYKSKQRIIIIKMMIIIIIWWWWLYKKCLASLTFECWFFRLKNVSKNRV